MKKKLWVGVVSLIFLISLTHLAHAAVSDPQTRGVEPGESKKPEDTLKEGQMSKEGQTEVGVIKKVDPNNRTIIIEMRTSLTGTKGQEMTFTLGEGAFKGGNLSDLKPGQYVQFTRTVRGTKVGPSHPQTPEQDIKQPLEEKAEGTKVGPSHKEPPERDIKQPAQSGEQAKTGQADQPTAPKVAAEGDTITSLQVIPESEWKTRLQSSGQPSR
jgi:hypothetical protein